MSSKNLLIYSIFTSQNSLKKYEDKVNLLSNNKSDYIYYSVKSSALIMHTVDFDMSQEYF